MDRTPLTDEQAAEVWRTIAAAPHPAVSAGPAPADLLPPAEELLSPGFPDAPAGWGLPLPLAYELARESEVLREFVGRARLEGWGEITCPPRDNHFWTLAKTLLLAGFPEQSWLTGPGRWPLDDLNRTWLAIALRRQHPPASDRNTPAVHISFLPGMDSAGRQWPPSDNATVGSPVLRLNLSLPDAVLLEIMPRAIAALREVTGTPAPKRGSGRPAQSGQAVDDPAKMANALATVRRSRAGCSPEQAIGRKVRNPHEPMTDARGLVRRALDRHLGEQLSSASGWRVAATSK